MLLCEMKMKSEFQSTAMQVEALQCIECEIMVDLSVKLFVEFACEALCFVCESRALREI